jgi:glycosyltransferase involved in cell wall biosynthesis
MKRICLIVCNLYTAEVFILDQIRALTAHYDVTLATNTQNARFLADRGICAKLINIPIERKIDFRNDIKALYWLYRMFQKESFALVHSVDPKAGLLSMTAGLLARVPVRIHTFTGQVWVTRRGAMRLLLKTVDRFIAQFATHILIDSASQRMFLMKQGIVAKEKSFVLGHGSISGVDVCRFRPNPSARQQIRAINSVPAESLLFLYMSRLTRDKGALVMAEAFAKFAASDDESHLFVVGPDEDGVLPAMISLFGKCLPRVHFFGFTSVPEEFMAGADVLCLPSYREGFGTVLINAAAVGIPALASRVYGSVDAVEDRITGLLHQPGNASEMAEHMMQLKIDPLLRKALGDNGRRRVVRDFSEKLVTSAVLNFYCDALAKTIGNSYSSEQIISADVRDELSAGVSKTLHATSPHPANSIQKYN